MQSSDEPEPSKEVESDDEDDKSAITLEIHDIQLGHAAEVK